MKFKIWTCLAALVFAAGNASAIDLAGIEIHGFISQGYLKSDDNNFFADTEDGTFQFNELGINFSKDLTDALRIGLQVFSRDFGEVGNNTVVIDWAYGDYRWRDWLGIRAGIMKVAYGLYNETRDVDMLRTSILLPQSIYSENRRDAFTRLQGGAIYGEIPLGVAGSLSYYGAVGTSNPDEDGGIAREIEDGGTFEVTGMENKTSYNGSLQWHTFVDGLRIGVSGVKATDLAVDLRTRVPMGPGLPAGIPLSFAVDFWAEVFSVEYTWKDLVVVSEYMISKTVDDLKGVYLNPYKSEGYYAGAAYRFTDWLQLGAYYSEFFPRKDDKGGDRFKESGEEFRAWQKDFALSARFDVGDNWTIKLEGHKMDGVGLLLRSDNPDGFEEDWYLFAAKVTFSF